MTLLDMLTAAISYGVTVAETKERRLESNRAWKKRNPAKVRAQKKRHREKHAEEINKRKREWHAERRAGA